MKSGNFPLYVTHPKSIKNKLLIFYNIKANVNRDPSAGLDSRISALTSSCNESSRRNFDSETMPSGDSSAATYSRDSFAASRASF